MIDVAQQIGAVRREVSTTERDGREAKVVVATQTYPQPLEDVWDAITSAERIPRWFLPVSGDLVLGGRFQLEGNAAGTVQECEQPTRLAITWEYGGEISWVEVSLSERDGATTLDLQHTAHVDEERWAEFGPGAVGVGWDMTLMGLAQHLTGAPAVVPEEAMAWMISDEGRAFTTASGEDWCRAAVADGDDESAASAASARTIAAYTGADLPDEATTEAPASQRG